MLSKIYSYGISGLEAYPITIEVDVSLGLPCTTIVGLPDNAIKESKERVRAAIKNSGYFYEPRRVTINLSPADIKKEGPSFDLAIALGILSSMEEIACEHMHQFVFLGELSLDGKVQAVNGVLPIALELMKKKELSLIVPFANRAEASLAEGIAVYPVKTLSEAIYVIQNYPDIQPYSSESIMAATQANEIDFSEVKGQAHVKRGLEIAAAGGHNVLLIGPPGTGKSMLAKRLPTILPDMNLEEALETTKIYSVMGLLADQRIMHKRPFRSPHHTTSDVAIVGGGSSPKPGEVTLSHNGILFLDELPEFNRNVLEALRQPLEDNHVTIARTSKTLRFPSEFMLIGAMNPCPCGWLMDPRRACRCSAHQIQNYISKISGPLLDRIDLHIEVPTLPSHELLSSVPAEASKQIKERTLKARAIQANRFKDTPHKINAYMDNRTIKKFCGLNKESKDLLKKVIEELGISARAYDKILRVARTIADLAGCEHIDIDHLAEAIQYRFLDRRWGK